MTKKDKKAKCKKLLYKDKLTKDDKVWLINQVFKFHKDYDNKVQGVPIDVTTGKSKRGSICFHIKKQDGSSIDISYIQCLEPTTKKTDVNKVLRNIIEYQIKYFRIKNNIPKDWDIDHYGLEFKDIVKFFMVGKDYEELHKNIIDKDNYTQTFKDENLIKEFEDLHKSLAKLQGLSKEEHKIKTYKWDV